MSDQKDALRNPGGWLRLIVGCTLLSLIWMIVLPWIGRHEGVRRDLQRLEQADVNAGALYYTDLRMLPALLCRLDRLHRENPAMFWRPGLAPSPAPSATAPRPGQ